MNIHKTTHQQSFWRESRPGRASTLCPMLAKYSFVGAEKLSAMSCPYPPELLSNWYNVSHREASARFCQMDVLSLPTRIVLQLTAHRLCYLRRGFPHGNLGTD